MARKKTVKNDSQLPRVFYLAFGGVGFLLLAIAALLFYFDQQAVHHYMKLEGVVIRNQFNNGMARPIISYSYEGKELTYVGSTYSNPPAFDRGEHVEIFVDPNNPKEVKVNGFVERFLAMSIVGGIGIVFLGFLALFHYVFN